MFDILSSALILTSLPAVQRGLSWQPNKPSGCAPDISGYDEVADASYRQNFTNMYRPYLLIKPSTWCYVIVLHGMFGDPSCYFVSDFLMQNLCLFCKFFVDTLAAGLRIYPTWKLGKKRVFQLSYQLHTSSADCSRELFKPLKDSASL